MAERTLIAVDIIQTPLGEAPEWVRQAWVGLRLPVAPGQSGARVWRGVGVLSGPWTYASQLWLWLTGRLLRIDGYLVDREAAFEALGRQSPEALAWWRAETMIGKRAGGGLIFDAPACQPVYAD